MQTTGTFGKQEIVDQRTILHYCLGTNAGRMWFSDRTPAVADSISAPA
ncbi:MAG: hypothetical protein K8F52_15840 [Candidatus Scalindua rubra]|nr:hypothetical protein [Candidatus Scalindua rubra]